MQPHPLRMPTCTVVFKEQSMERRKRMGIEPNTKTRSKLFMVCWKFMVWPVPCNIYCTWANVVLRIIKLQLLTLAMCLILGQDVIVIASTAVSCRSCCTQETQLAAVTIVIRTWICSYTKVITIVTKKCM